MFKNEKSSIKLTAAPVAHWNLGPPILVFRELEAIKKKQNVFSLRVPNLLYFATSSPEECETWFQLIKNFCDIWHPGNDPETPHSFISKNFSVPTWCDKCKKFIWGLTRNGLSCSACGYNVHKDCRPSIPNNCGLAYSSTDLGPAPMKRFLNSSVESASTSKTNSPNTKRNNDVHMSGGSSGIIMTSRSDDYRNSPMIPRGSSDLHSIGSSGSHTDLSSNHTNNTQIIKSMEGESNIDPTAIDLGKKLGKGAFGSVFEATLFNKDVAVKIIESADHFFKDTKDFHKFIQAYRSEVEVLKSIRHPNVVLYMGSAILETKLLIVSELLDIDLYNLLVRPSAPHLGAPTKITMLRDAALAMSYLHGRDPIFLHLDIKPANIMLDSNGVVKVCDFGQAIAKRKADPNIEAVITGTPYFMAPEMLQGKQVNEKADIYSFSITMWEVLYQEQAYSFKSIPPMINAICDNHQRPEIKDLRVYTDDPEPQPPLPDLVKLFEKTWCHEPEKRLAFNSIIPILNDLQLEYSIRDPKGADFWEEYFFKKGKIREQVRYDTLVTAFLEAYPLPRNTPDLVTSRGALFFRAFFSTLHEVNRKHEPLISMQDFGHVLDWIGPLEKDNHLFIKAFNLIKSPWFFGHINKDEAFNKLQSQPPGTFLIRFSSDPGHFTISRIKHDKTLQVVHQRISYHRAEGIFAAKQNRSDPLKKYPSLEALIEAFKDTLIKPCPGHPFSHLLASDNQTFYLPFSNDD